MACLSAIALWAAPCYSGPVSRVGRAPSSAAAGIQQPRDYGITEIGDARRPSELREGLAAPDSGPEAKTPKQESENEEAGRGRPKLASGPDYVGVVGLSATVYGLFVALAVYISDKKWQIDTGKRLDVITGDNKSLLNQAHVHAVQTSDNHGQIAKVLEWLVLKS